MGKGKPDCSLVNCIVPARVAGTHRILQFRTEGVIIENDVKRHDAMIFRFHLLVPMLIFCLIIFSEVISCVLG